MFSVYFAFFRVFSRTKLAGFCKEEPFYSSKSFSINRLNISHPQNKPIFRTKQTQSKGKLRQNRTQTKPILANFEFPRVGIGASQNLNPKTSVFSFQPSVFKITSPRHSNVKNSDTGSISTSSTKARRSP